ncbi:MAG: ribonuclease R [Fusobacteria bacterium]|nr:ribonuclease R [Fusobacteriota bacterium]
MDKEQLYFNINQKDYLPLTYEEMLKAWKIEKADELLLQEYLAELVKDGLIYLSKKHKYISIREKGLKTGRLYTNEKGFGFVKDNESEEEYFIPHKSLKDAQDKDLVLISPVASKSGKNKEGKVEKVIERGTKSFIGQTEYNRGKLIIRPLDNKLFGDYNFTYKGLKKGDKVFVRVTSFPEGRRPGEVEIISLVSQIEEKDLAIEAIIAKYGLIKDFPKEVLAAAESVPDEVSKEEIEDRHDLRELFTVTIDGEDARDFDDAITLEKIDDIYRLGVHIADVSYYVPENSVIDKEAYNRATSVYFPDRVLPMLPVALSNNICSLNEGVPRMAMTAMMDIDTKGKVISYEIFPSVIKSNHRMTYTNVAKILKRHEDESQVAELDLYKPIFEWIDLMADLSDIMTNKRAKRGAVFFDFPEIKIFVDEKGHPVKLDKRVRNKAESIIEEFMLLANETVAEHLYWLGATCIYRVHEEPPYEGITNFNRIGAPYGFNLKQDPSGKVHPREYQNIIDKLENHPMKELLMSLLLRSMSHARYDIRALGHYGLSVIYYCHFTSPIRRYPDLEVHRILKRYLKNQLPDELEKARLNYQAYRSAVQSSDREIAAENAERDVDKIMVVLYMKDYLGESFKGKISGMINSGLFIELDNLAEGFLPYATLPGYYTYFEQEMVVRDGSGKVRFKIGDYLEVTLVKADVLTGHLDFILKEGNEIDQNSRK